MEHLQQLFQSALGWWAYIGLAALVFAEGPIATVVGSVAASAGYLNPVMVFASASAGNLTADVLWYLVGYLGKFEWLVSLGKWVGFTREQVMDIEEDIEENVLKMLFIAKLTLGFVIPALIATGLARIPIRKWFGILILAEAIWTGSLVLAGFYFGKYLQTMRTGLQYITLAGGLIFFALIIRHLVQRRKKIFRKSGD
jgi:membrane protein DedA with SNARE-associated domain